jgi:hypothetical protein
MADESIVITRELIHTARSIYASIIKVTITWACATGAATITTTAFPADVQKNLEGRYCVLGTTNPGAVAPTTDYDIYILDALGVDIFGGALNDRHTSANEQSLPLLAPSTYGKRLVVDQLSFKLDGNSVNNAAGVCVLYFELGR